MQNKDSYTIAVFSGDGIGIEVTEPCLSLMQRACELAGAKPLTFNQLAAGAQTYVETGTALPEESVVQAKLADAILLSAMGDPNVRYDDGTEITPQIDLRFALNLYAGIRPVRSIPGVPSPLADERANALDFVLIRESVEGLFAPQAKGTLVDNAVATETLVITKEISDKLFDATFKVWQQRQKRGRGCNRVTCIDKANVFGAFAFFRDLFYEAADRYNQNNPEQQVDSSRVDHAYVDATALNLVAKPWEFDVMVTENMFGDILSDQGAALIGGMGYAPSADIGDEHAVFQPCHGTAPDIVGTGMANPTAMFLSGAMLLDWLAQKYNDDKLATAAELIESSVNKAFGSGQLRTCELGGSSGLKEVSDAVNAALESKAETKA